MPESKAQRRLREQRAADGVCLKCGGILENTRFKNCYECRMQITESKKRYYARERRAESGIPAVLSISEVCTMAAARGISYGQMVVEIEKGRRLK